MLALIAGTGHLPATLFRRLSQEGRTPLVCALEGFVPEIAPQVTFRLEHLGSFLRQLRNDGVSQICMAGAVRRPEIDPTEIDDQTLPLVPRLQAAMAKGDDGTLREIIKIIEDHDLTVIGAAELVPDLLPPLGVLTRAVPSEIDEQNARLGDRTLQIMGTADSGQACLIKDNAVLAQEGPEGTDAMMLQFARSQEQPLNFVDDLVLSATDWVAGRAGEAKGAILFKGPKPNQDRRADLPVIGPDTALNASAAGLSWIVIEEGGVMVLELPRVRQILDAHGLFLWVRTWD